MTADDLGWDTFDVVDPKTTGKRRQHTTTKRRKGPSKGGRGKVARMRERKRKP